MVSQEKSEKKCLFNDDKLDCCHSSEAILLILSRTPWRLSIKELSEITSFHRNTIRPTLYTLKEKEKIQSTGDAKSSQYYYGGVIDFYRRQTKAFEMLDLPQDQVKDIVMNIGYNIVKSTLEEALEDGPKFKHNSLFEALLHIKLAYPFSDITVNEHGKAISTTVFTVPDKKLGDQVDPTNFNLRIHSCLCKGDEKDHISCSMVIGALKGAIEGACGVKADVTWSGSGIDSKYGSYCQYQIISEMTIPNKEKDKQKTKISISQ